MMKRLVAVTGAAALVAVLVSTAALAKGASEATITGPGLANGITLAGEGQARGGQLMQLAEAAGFFPSVFVTSPNPMLSRQPNGVLGPRYRITYVMPGPNNMVDELRQDLYPYAKPNPVTYMEPGQSYFGSERTVGGWYVATAALKDDLVAAGVPEAPPAGGDGSDFPWAIVGALAAVAAALVLVAVTALLIRRRPGAAPA